MSLETLREQLTALDDELMDLVARRQALVAEIGRTKRAGGIGTRDFAREKVVLEGARTRAEALGVSGDLAEQVFTALIRHSLISQEGARIAADGRGDGRRALVIGGSGRMGAWFCRFLRSQGYTVEVADPAGALDGFMHVDDWETVELTHDLIVLATPLRLTAELMHALAARRPPGLIMEIGSLKSPLRDGIDALRAAGCQIASVHPMFGPDTRLLSGRHVIFVDTEQPATLVQAREMFASTMAEQVEMSLDDHDRLIAYVLGLSHALNIAFFSVLEGSRESAPRLEQISSTTFDAQLDVAGRVAGESPWLYFEIQSLNAHGLRPLRALESTVQRLRELVESGDETGFVELMQTGERYFNRSRTANAG